MGVPHRAGSVAPRPGIVGLSSSARPWVRAGYYGHPAIPTGMMSAMARFSRCCLVQEVRAVVGIRADEPARSLRAVAHGTARVPHAYRSAFAPTASGADLCISSGATASKDRYFGFSGRSGQGDTALGTVVEGTVDVLIRKHWSVNLHGGTMFCKRGGDQHVHRQASHALVTGKRRSLLTNTRSLAMNAVTNADSIRATESSLCRRCRSPTLCTPLVWPSVRWARRRSSARSSSDGRRSSRS